jgi:hypothetical protein
MALALPYPGFSWGLSQHIGPGTQPRAIFELLQAAYTYGNEIDYAEQITEYITGQGLLSENIRQDSGRPDLWRDYQQVLSELGLIVSTNYTNHVQVTPIGLMYLDGSIGYSELITTQALNYQYPNGHKRDISTTQRAELNSANIPVPRTRFELDATYGVLIKPAVLVLRVLLELQQLRGQISGLSVTEVLHCLVPVKRNSEWPLALNELLAFRSAGFDPRSDGRRRRHVQEWFRLLKMTDLFIYAEDQRLYLSEVANANLDFTYQLCQYHEDEATFWLLPSTSNLNQIALSWFGYFGNPDPLSQWVIADLNDLNYVKENYLATEETEDDKEATTLTHDKSLEVNLHPFSYARERQYSDFDSKEPITTDQSAARKRQQTSTRLHEEIVIALAKKLAAANYAVQEDPNSVDLLVTRDDKHTILEVKTITRRNLDQRLRLGVGQLLEYRYRLYRTFNSKPNAILVLSSTANFAAWIHDYFSADIQIGLVSFAKTDEFHAYTEGEIESVLTSSNNIL